MWELNPLNWRRHNLPVRREPYQSSPGNQNLPSIDRILDDFFDSPMMESMTRDFVPSLDVSETDNEVRIDCELPGMDEKDIDVSVCGDSLCIKGEKKTEEERREGGMYRTERRYGSFSRTVELPAGLDLDNVNADFKNGVLSIRLPKTEEYKKQVRNIPIGRRSEEPPKEPS